MNRQIRYTLRKLSFCQGGYLSSEYHILEYSVVCRCEATASAALMVTYHIMLLNKNNFSKKGLAWSRSRTDELGPSWVGFPTTSIKTVHVFQGHCLHVSWDGSDGHMPKLWQGHANNFIAWMLPQTSAIILFGLLIPK